MKLISMTDFVLEQGKPNNTDSQFADKVMAYANFLKQHLTLSMFVPAKKVNGVWVVLEEDDLYELYLKDMYIFDGNYKREEACQEYIEAKSEVLFEGCEFTSKTKLETFDKGVVIDKDYQIVWQMHHEGIIEDLLFQGLEIILTQTAQKQIGL